MKIEEFDRITGLTGVLPQRAQRSQSLKRFLSRRPPRPFGKLRVNSAQGRPLAVTASPPPPFPGARITVDVKEGELAVEVEQTKKPEAKEEAEV